MSSDEAGRLKALIFAAGLGERMRPLTDHTPKPLLRVAGRPLIAWHLQRLAAIGVREVVVNTSWLAGCFPPALGDGSRWGLQLTFVDEGPVALETGGGMLNALPLLGDAPFIAINGDVWSDYPLAQLPVSLRGDAHLVLVDNPPHHPAGDFGLQGDAWLTDDNGPRHTFSGIGVYSPRLLQGWRKVIGTAPGSECDPPRFKLAPLLFDAIARRRISGELHPGQWTDVGTPARLQALDRDLRAALRPQAPG